MNIQVNIQPQSRDDEGKTIRNIFVSHSSPTLVTGTGVFIPMEVIREFAGSGKRFSADEFFVWLTAVDQEERQREIKADREAAQALAALQRGEWTPVRSAEFDAFLGSGDGGGD
jgi:hypothetical protein